MIRIETSVEIDRPSDKELNYVSTFENNPRWQSGQIEAHTTSEGELRVGSTYDQVAKFMGREILSSVEGDASGFF